MTPFYDRFASDWERVTGDEGGPYKRLVLNAAVAAALGDLRGARVLELGCGNGYLARRLSRRTPPALWVCVDHSQPLLRFARARVPALARCDFAQPLPFRDATFDVVLAVMVLNELAGPVARRAMSESFRVLRPGGRFVAAVMHPKFVRALDRDGALRRDRAGTLTMPGPEGLRLPVVAREEADWKRLLEREGFAAVTASEVASTPEFVREKPDLRLPPTLSRALLLEARRS